MSLSTFSRRTVCRPYLIQQMGMWFSATAMTLLMLSFGIPAHVQMSAGIKFVALGIPIFAAATTGLLFFKALWEWLQPIELEAEASFKGVPPEPVCENGLFCPGRFRHRWIETESGGELIVPRSEKFRVMMVGVVHALMMLSLLLALLWFTEAGIPLPPPLLLGLRCLGTALAIVVAITLGAMFYVLSESQFKARFHMDRLTRVCVLRDQKRVEKIPLADVRAVQACLYFRAFGEKGAGAHWCMEINLVLRKESEPETTRITLLLAGREFGTTLREAKRMAAAMSVPLINHVTKEEYRSEKQRYKARPGVSGRWSSF